MEEVSAGAAPGRAGEPVNHPGDPERHGGPGTPAEAPGTPAEAPGEVAGPPVEAAARERRGLRGFLRRLASTKEELQAEELQATSGKEGATPVARCAERKRACVAGTLRTVTLRPLGGAPALEAELYDGSAAISLIWLGRRKIIGIEPGRRLRAEGLVSMQDGRKVMFNPRYELRGP